MCPSNPPSCRFIATLFVLLIVFVVLFHPEWVWGNG
jgi:hypothetical protein